MIFHDLETNRLILKNITNLDRDFIFKQFSNDIVNKYLYDEEPYTSVEEADGLIEFYTEPEPRSQHRWIIINKLTGDKMGTCGYHCWDTEKASCEIGYDLYPDYINQGYMNEALNKIIDFAKCEMKINHIEACIYVDNTRSINAVTKLGFVRSNQTRIYEYRGKEYLHYIYTLD